MQQCFCCFGEIERNPWPQAMGAAQLGRALQGFAGLRQRGQEHSRSLNEPPRFCTRFRVRVFCKGKGEPAVVTTLLRPWENSSRKRESYLCQSAHTALFFQPAFCLSSVCLTQLTQLSPPATRVMLRTILYLHCCCQISLAPGLCLLWSLPFPGRASPMFVYDWNRSPSQPHPANIAQAPAKSSSTPHDNVSYSQGPAASAGDTELPKAPNQLQN